MQHPWHHLTSEEALKKLDVKVSGGLSSAEVLERRKIHGKNSLPEPPIRSLFSILLHQFQSPLIYLLLAAAGISFLIGDYKDSLVILIVVVLNALVGAFQEGRAEQSLVSLRRLAHLKAQVFRIGQQTVIPAEELVPGDLITIAAGDAVPADGRIIEAQSVMASEAALTGESLPVAKTLQALPITHGLSDRSNMVYAGTHITAGRALVLVTATGIENEVGKIATLTSATVQPKTQLELRIQQFGKYIAIAALVLFSLVLLIGLMRGIEFSTIFMIAVSQMVSLVPEGLPVAVTIALAVGVQRMARKGTIVRKLAAVETLGATSIICTDKTGTLTKNEMTVTAIYLPQGDRNIGVQGIGYSPSGAFNEISASGKSLVLEAQADPALLLLLRAATLCNDSNLISPKDPAALEGNRWRIIGDPTEAALLTAAAKAGIKIDALRKEYLRTAEIPFDADGKMMATGHRQDGVELVFIKGAPEIFFEYCALDSQKREQAKAASQKMADQALRVLAVGQIENSSLNPAGGFRALKGKVQLLGLVGELDPPRIEVASAVRECQAAGIRPVMVTGDHKATALAIAKSLEICPPDGLAIEGSELEKMTESDLHSRIDQVKVFARVHPAQKLRIVQAYQARGNVVAMTGDGVNDAPALVQANVGVAMGITGTEVAKEAAKIVITDDNFSTIVAAVAEGRLVYQNIKKLILFLFVTSIDEVIILFLALLFGYPPPLAAVQILWINLVSEGTLTVNLIMEPFEGDEMQRAPIAMTESLFDRSLLLRMPIMILASVISTFGWFLYRSYLGVPAELVQSETFTALVVSQWFNVLNCRSATRSALSWDLFKNPWLLGGLLVANLMHLLVIYWEPLARFFHTVPIAPEQFIAIGVVASSVLWVEEFRKLLVRQRMRKENL